MPRVRFSAEITAVSTHRLPWLGISARYSRLQAPQTTIMTPSDFHAPQRATIAPPRNTPTMPIHAPELGDGTDLGLGEAHVAVERAP